MNIYFLVEGKTEADVYPAWLSYLIPELQKVDNYEDAEQNNYYLFSSYGIPSIYNDIPNAIEDINRSAKYNYFVVCVDSDAATVAQREEKILRLLEENIRLNDASLKIIVQNRCIETWFLGNRKVYTRYPQNNPKFIEYSAFYNISQNNPELMKKPDTFEGSIAEFHFRYLKSMFNERGNMSYSKANAAVVQGLSYFKELQSRVDDEPSHLATFTNFLQFCNKLKAEIAR
jgi:hypothetical protein